MSRTYYDEATGILYAGFRYPGVVEYVGALNTRDGSIKQLAEIRRAMNYRGHFACLRRFQWHGLLHQQQPWRRVAALADGS